MLTEATSEMNTHDTVNTLLLDSSIQLRAFPSDVKKVDEQNAPGFTIIADDIKQKIESACECEDADINLELLHAKLKLSLEERVSKFQSGNITIFIERSYDKNNVELLSKTSLDGSYRYKYQAEMLTTFQIEVKKTKLFVKNIINTETYIYTSNSVFNTISKLD